jgi:sugar lactone lactonase YvrE
VRQKGSSITTLREGLDGLQLSPDGSTLYYSPLTSDYLYSIPTANLLQRDEDNVLAEMEAKGNVTSYGQRGGNANGFEGDDQGRVYQLMPEHNAIYYFDPKDLQTKGFVRGESSISSPFPSPSFSPSLL